MTGQPGGDLEVADQRRPTGEAVATGHRQLCSVQWEFLRRSVFRAWMPSLHQVERIGIAGPHAALQAPRIGPEPVE
jgi:hypothetical protein